MKPLGELLASDVMSTDVKTVGDSDRLVDAISIMDQERISALPVVDSQGIVVGVLSMTDLIEITHEIQSDLTALHYVKESTQKFLIELLVEQGDTTFVRDVMTAPVTTIEPETNLVVAARILTEHGYRHLPVVSQNGKSTGMLSASDFVRAFAQQAGMVTG